MNQYLRVPYVDGGRTMAGLDCWGLALRVRADLGLPELPADPAAIRGNGSAIAAQFWSISESMDRGEPAPGALAAVFKGSLFVHVGVVVQADGRLWVMETNPDVGFMMRRVSDFIAAYYKVIFYNDRNLPESA